MFRSSKVSSALKKYGKDIKISHGTAMLFSTSRYSCDSDLLHTSIIPTMHFQKSLPRLPIPKLEDTIQRYLMAQKPLLNSEEYIKTKEIAENFLGYEGRGLHADLVEKDKLLKHTSYISEPWFDMYLRYRDSIVLNHNPYILTTDDPHTNDQLTRAAKLIHNALRFKKSLDANLLAPDVYHLNAKKSDTQLFKRLSSLTPTALSWYVAYLFKAFPLDMSQYNRLFNSTRVPRREKDELKTVKGARQMLVIRNGNIFLFDAIRSDGQLIPKEELYANLVEIMKRSDEKVEHPLSVLTAEPRDKWAAIREHIESNPKNAEMMQKLDGALFGLFLDDEDCNDENDATRMFLYGEGHSRWFDKSFHMALSKNGKMGINFEHAWGDGVAMVRFLNETVEASAKDTFVPPQSNNSLLTVQQLDFELDRTTKEAIVEAQKRFEERTSKLMFNTMKVEGFGKNHLKSNKLSPDATIQLAFQMANYRLNGKHVPTYESCSTAAFKHGRTETIRPCTVATVACTEAFEASHSAGVDEMLSLLKESSNMHAKITKEAAMGQGFDRHLFALRTLAEKSNRKVEFFDDDAYKRINNIILSTSTVFSENIQVGGFAPVTPNGFGISYIVHNDWMGCNCSSYPDSPKGGEFVELVKQSLHDIHAVLLGKNFKL